VVGGQGLVRLIPERWLRWAAVLAFVAMGVWVGAGTLI